MHMQYKVDPDDALALPSFRSLYLLTATVGLLVAGDLVFWWLGYESLRNPLGVNLSLIAAVLGGARIIYGALSALLEGDVGADLALAIAMLAALVLKEYWVGAEVVLIAMIGESLEAITFSRTHREIQKILELRPRSVRVRRGISEVEIPVSQVQVGDVVVVRPGERIAVDGTVLVGRSTVDESTLTGESLPVDKGESDSVFAGTLNQFGALEIRADVVGEHTTLGQVIQLVAEAQHHKARVERTADRLARYFLPFVLVLALGTFVVTNWTTLASANPAAGPWVWMPTLSVLVVTCPCALVLATPAAMMAALAWLVRRGVLIKGGVALERFASVSRIAFDKTGTLTTGKLQLGDCVPLGSHTPTDLLRWAASAEQSSEHLIAQVIVRSAREQGLEIGPVDDFQALPGYGVSARLRGGDRLLVGNRRLMAEQGIEIAADVDRASEKLEAAGQTPLVVAIGSSIVGLVGVRDTVRPEAARVIRELRDLGIAEVVLLTGDRPAAAAQVAREVGIDRFAAELRPEEKARWLANWRCAVQPSGKDNSPIHVAMIGDGVNDAPALAAADVGLALAGVGSDLAAEAGDLVLMGDPLTPLPGLLRLSRETVRVIRQNILLFAFFVNFVGVALTAWIIPTWSEAWLKRSPVAAAIFHQLGSVLVLLNAMRLLWFERWHASLPGRIETALAEICGRALAVFDPLVAAGRWSWSVRRQVVRAAFTLLVIGYLAQVVVFVEPDEVAVVQRFGRFHAELGPGPHLRLPPPWDAIIREKPARVRTIEIGLRSTQPSGTPTGPIEWNSQHELGLLARPQNEAIILTGEQSLVELAGTIQYRVRDLRAFRFGVRLPERVLQSAAEGIVREVVGTHPLLADGERSAAEILTTGRGTLEREIRDRLQSRVDALGLGIEILPGGVCLQDVHPPLPVVGAFRDVSSAFKEKERMKNEGDAYHRQMVIRAGGLAAWTKLSGATTELNEETWTALRPQLAGEAAAELAAAEALAEDGRQVAEGTAASFALSEAAHAANPQLTEWRLFLDALTTALPGKSKLILDGPSGGRRHLFYGFPKEKQAPLIPLAPRRPDGVPQDD
jgi:Cu+-exporting ATPase